MQENVDYAEYPGIRAPSDAILNCVQEKCQRPGGIIAVHFELQREVALALRVLRKQRPWQQGPVANVVVLDNFVAIVKNEFGMQKGKEERAQPGNNGNGKSEEGNVPHDSTFINSIMRKKQYDDLNAVDYANAKALGSSNCRRLHVVVPTMKAGGEEQVTDLHQ